MEATPIEYAVGIGSCAPFYKTLYPKPAQNIARVLRRLGYKRVYITRAVSLDTARNRRAFLTS